MKQTKQVVMVAAALLGAGLLAGCGSLSHDIARDGSHAGQLVWPKPSGTNPLQNGGMFPNMANLKQVQPGLNKHQVMALIGPPQFQEGFWDVHEWDYLMNFRKDGTVTQCEYKILFSRSMQVGSTYWNPTSCADFLNPPPPPPPPAPKVQTFTLSASALFGFNQYRLADIKAGGRTQLDDLATKLNAPDVKTEQVEVVGYTDRLGSDAYNQKLSTERADTVRDYLVSHGVDSSRIDAEGRGEADPVVTCNDKSRAKLIACLAPNRRVVVKVDASH